MIAAVLDASVVVKLLIREEDSPGALALVASLDRPVVPDWCILECASALWVHAARHGLSPEVAAEALRGLARINLKLSPSSDVVPASLELALESGHSPYDCLYIITAHAEALPLVTADRAQHRLAERILGEERAILLSAWSA